MKILVLCRRLPFPITDGESLRIFNYAKHLSGANELDLVCTGAGSSLPEIDAIFRRVEVVPVADVATTGPTLGRLVDAFRVDSFAVTFPEVAAHLVRVVPARDYDVIWTSTDLVRCVPEDCNVPVLTDVCDDGVLLIRRELATARGWLDRLRLRKRLAVARRFEERYFAPSDACLFVSDADAGSFQNLAPGARSEVIPNGVDADYFAPSPEPIEPATLVFEGSMDFAPNADAAVYLCRELLPLIHARRPDVRVLIVGRDPLPEVRALASEAVTVTGRVDDVRPYLARATVFVCPLRSGAGIKNKILQAWSMGKPVIATPVSLGGLDYEDGKNLVVAAGPQQFAQRVLELLDDPSRCAGLGRAARDTVLTSYRWQARSRQLESLLESLVVPYAARRAASARAAADPPKRVHRILMFALQFPPYGLSTGRLRTLGFLRHLPATGWLPLVVTARESAFVGRDEKTMADVPRGARVLRAWGVDLSRLLSFRGLHPHWVETPDRWNTWAIGAAVAGAKAARRYRVDAIWATFPVPSALLAGLIVRRLTGLPLVADLRDPMVYETWPERRWDRRVYAWLERRVVRQAAAVVLTTPSGCEMYRERYRDVAPDRFCHIPNGIDEALLEEGPRSPGQIRSAGPITLVHSGLMEIPDRDPTAFFRALRLLAERGALPRRGLRVVLRASGREEQYRSMADAEGLCDLVDVAPRVPYDEALAEMHGASGLLLFQGAACNRQIPAKAYEYLLTQRPIVGLMDPKGDTHALVYGKWGVPYCADMADAEAIAQTLARFLADVERGEAFVPSASLIHGHLRRTQARELGRVLDQVCPGIQPSTCSAVSPLEYKAGSR